MFCPSCLGFLVDLVSPTPVQEATGVQPDSSSHQACSVFSGPGFFFDVVPSEVSPMFGSPIPAAGCSQLSSAVILLCQGPRCSWPYPSRQSDVWSLGSTQSLCYNSASLTRARSSYTPPRSPSCAPPPLSTPQLRGALRLVVFCFLTPPRDWYDPFCYSPPFS